MKTTVKEGVSIIIPTYREAGNIAALMQAIAEIDFEGTCFEVIIVDDGSDDGTIPLIKQHLSLFPWLKLIERSGTRDLSRSIIQGFQSAQFEVLLTFDADLSHPARLIPTLVKTLMQPGVDFVIGSRYIKGGSMGEDWPFTRKCTSRFAAGLARFVLGVPVEDPLSGFIAIRKSTFLKSDHLKPIGWKIGLELMVKCHCQTIREIPIHFSQRLSGSSKLNLKIALDYFRHLLLLLRYQLSRQFAFRERRD